MKKYFSLFTFIFSLLLMSFMADETMTKEKGTFVINTTELGKDVEGYQGPTPLKVYIKNNKVEKIEFLKSTETPKYYDRVKKFLQTKWDGLKVKEAREKEVDVVLEVDLFVLHALVEEPVRKPERIVVVHSVLSFLRR